jgi:hypothetical protein
MTDPQRGGPVEVTLGQHTIPVYAQRHAYLINRVGRFIRDLQQSAGDTGSDDLLPYIQARSYELLCALMPNLEKRLPEYEYRGYSSREAMDAGDYDPEQDQSPTLPEIRRALTEASTVNGFDVLLHLRALVDPQLVKGWVSAQVAEAILQTSPSSPSANGASDSTTSTPKPPTSMPNTD